MAMRRGFTLVEIMVVIGIFTILMSAGTTVILQVLQASRKAQVEAELHQNLSLAFETISRQVRKAGCIEVLDPINSNPPVNTRGKTLNLYSTYSTGACTGSLNSSFTISGGSLVKTPGGTVTSPKIIIFIPPWVATPCGCYFDSPPSFFEKSVDGRTVKTSLMVNSVGGSRWDFSGSQIATESVSLRQFAF